jgi:diaminohydroxyphosphoribosylaminopyrimidine deaminase/5-amino-6-(5-phosphoribosylamino)uracil reductase
VEDETGLTSLDRLYLDRAYELAARGIGSTSPNPPVGAVVVRDGKILGEGYHHVAGAPHGEANALAQAGDARGATLYVSLEPCNHVGRTPACSQAVIDAGIARVVIGTYDPNPRTNAGGVAQLRDAGLGVAIADDLRALQLVEPFARAVRDKRAYVTLKMAMSVDGAITSKPGVQEWITGEAERMYVRDLRVAYDAVMVGAGTVRVDDPQLTVRPPHDRQRPYVRVVVCETDVVPLESRVFATVDGYAKTVVLAPAGARARFAPLESVADVLFTGDDDAKQLDLAEAMRALYAHGIYSVLCEGGPTLGARCIAAGLVDRMYWAIAPVFLQSPTAVPVLAGVDMAGLGAKVRFDRVEQVGQDVMISGTFDV